jgi:quinohemoprotein ethanol dehydrogenase
MQAPKNGFFYVLDAATGDLLSADPYVDVSWASHVDLASGRPVERPEAHWSDEPAIVTPSIVGGHNWHPMSFSPRTGWVYIPSITAGYRFVPDPDFRYTPGRFNTAEDWPALMAESEGLEDALRWCNPTHITAWDPVAKRPVWRVSHATELPGGLLVTAGDLLFQGRPEGRFVAYDARSGAALWEADTGVGVMAPAVSYLAGGEQYVAVLAGIGGSPALQFAPLGVENRGRLFAFKLGGEAEMPPAMPRPPGTVHTPKVALEPARVARGRGLYAEHCMRCHGPAAKSNGVMPDLRHASEEVHERWDEIVLGGVHQARGMASFADLLSPEDARSIHAYVVERATHEPALLERLAGWFGRNACIPLSLAID